MENKIKSEQLEIVVDQQTRLNKLIFSIGDIEVQKHKALHMLDGLVAEIDDYKKILEAEYGAVNINLSDGSFTKIENDGTNNQEN
jgi:hypothetical protein